MITKIWYSIRNGGDGSAVLVLMESKELAELDQECDLYDEGWAEDCSGWITVESDSPITVKGNISTVDGEIEDIEEDYKIGDKYFPTKRYEALKKLKERNSI